MSAELTGNDAISEFLLENWNAIARRSASTTTRRLLAARAWERRLAYVNRVALAVWAFLIVQFPLLCYAFQALEESALELCATF